ncbi:MAG: LuxR C-terminal-related transcriptional regulator [Chloroflexota bacterium]
MSFFQRLLYLLGFLQAPTPHTYNLKSDIQLRIADLAQQEQRSPEELTEQLLSQALSQHDSANDLWQRWNSLSPREQQVAALTCLDYTNPQIAAILGLSVETIRTHSRNTQIKFNVNSKPALRVLLADWDFSKWDAQI